ncbi:hypothetical protein N7516_006001 [Penicillium verrucosum]|uniref:uncharacterized protein n=1 Tax=Penicillium verrucosum TaxID=60171 RepID=UPI0025455808|nr:uncharacterized protein N7516_006001 [Penicillium verrucosum]KAJ5931512.1 hypothetical protein N7516_006001 [Penicillium verrucosum]
MHINTRWAPRLIHVVLFVVRCFLSLVTDPGGDIAIGHPPPGRLSVESKVQFIRQAEDPETSLDTTASGTGIQAEVVAQRV